MENRAVWLVGSGKEPRIGSAPIPEPGEGQLLIRVSMTKCVVSSFGYWQPIRL
jgi:hypothetical protein